MRPSLLTTSPWMRTGTRNSHSALKRSRPVSTPATTKCWEICPSPSMSAGRDSMSYSTKRRRNSSTTCRRCRWLPARRPSRRLPRRRGGGSRPASVSEAPSCPHGKLDPTPHRGAVRQSVLTVPPKSTSRKPAPMSWCRRSVNSPRTSSGTLQALVRATAQEVERHEPALEAARAAFQLRLEVEEAPIPVVDVDLEGCIRQSATWHSVQPSAPGRATPARVLRGRSPRRPDAARSAGTTRPGRGRPR